MTWTPFNNRLFTRFGVRVPTFAISPWVSKQTVTSNLAQSQNIDFEHTSIAKTILDWFCPWADVSAMGERLAGAHSLRGLINSEPRATAPAPSQDELKLPRDDRRIAVGGTSPEPVDLGEIELSSDFHSLIAGLGKHSAKTRRATT